MQIKEDIWYFKLWIRPLPVMYPDRKLWHPKNTFQIFFFQLYFNKKYFEVAINDFTMHLIISKWLRIQKWKTMRQRGWSKSRNCQQKCFHAFNYVIDHVSIHFFFYVDSLLSSLCSSYKLIPIQFFCLNIWIF